MKTSPKHFPRYWPALVLVTALAVATVMGACSSTPTTAPTTIIAPTTAPATTTAPAPTLSSIAVIPATPANLAVGSTQQFTASGIYSGGSSANITSQVTWTSSNATVATISTIGLATGVASGSANITASASGVTSPAVTLTVAP